MGRNVMLKEFVARVFLILFIIGMTSEAADDSGMSGTAKQPRLGPGSKDTSASTPSETAS
jgi:hypothetical protein